MSDKSICDRVFRSKTSMSNATFHSLNSRSDGLRCDFSTNKLKMSMSNMSFPNFNSRSDGLPYDFSTNKLKYSSYVSTSEPRGKDSAPRILGVFIRPPAKFRQSFARPVLEKIEIFSATAKLPSLIRGDL